jgi:DNA gyrase/topoisomerase IV subunit B
VRNNQLSYDEISYLLSKNYLIKEIQDGLKYQFSPKIIEAIGTLPPFYNQSSWWNGLITKLNQGEYQTYKLVNPSVVLHEEQGNFREYNISSLVSSDYYYNIMNAFDTFKPYLGKASVVIGRIKRVFNNIFLAIEFLVNYSKNARSLKRYKGLGEMNVDQLWISTMDPASRRLFKMNIEDAKRAEYMFTLLMGHTVEARRDFIINQAKYVKFQI